MSEPSMERYREAEVPPRSEGRRKNLLIAYGIVGSLTILLAGVTAAECHNYSVATVGHPSWIPSAVYGGVLWLWWTGIAALLGRAGRRWPALWITSWSNGLLQVFIGLTMALIHLEVLGAAMRTAIRRWPPYTHGNGPLDPTHIGFDILLYMVAWAAGAAIYSQIARQRQAIETAELKQQLASAHLRALQMQLEPHFLFNTLNAITTLVELGRQKEAVETLAHLNAILKSTLAQSTPQKVSLAQELSVMENYLAIEQVRFADRLRVEFTVDPNALDGMVPRFLLQPIVENAIRHGISQLEEEGIIHASIKREGGVLHLSVWDNGPGLQGKSNHAGHGIGLRNTEDRLAHFYPRNYGFFSGERKAGGFEVSITIPYERALA